ncbi:hypothetical protein MUK42_28451 [Musa troglodytarum]|uniref:Uncharacterized protein n=1 Tax=Musa troglodytarum TaxID=320322 RepID=A0A9E7F7R6_9LILI|nr:hypothetical protein MUK42_28451 [Musa troglodytarum]
MPRGVPGSSPGKPRARRKIATRPSRRGLLRPRRQGPRHMQRRPRRNRSDPPLADPSRDRGRSARPSRRHLTPRDQRGPAAPSPEGPGRPRRRHARRPGRRRRPQPPRVLLLFAEKRPPPPQPPLPLLERVPAVVSVAVAAGHREQRCRAPQPRGGRHRGVRGARVHHERGALAHDAGPGGGDPLPGPRPPGPLLGPADLRVGATHDVAPRADHRGVEEGQEGPGGAAEGDPADREVHAPIDGADREHSTADDAGGGDGAAAEGGGVGAGLRGSQGGARSFGAPSQGGIPSDRARPHRRPRLLVTSRPMNEQRSEKIMGVLFSFLSFFCYW